MNTTKKSSTNFIQSVDRALQILECFSEKEKELGVTEISKALSLHKSTAFGLLATLENRGYIEQNKENGKYKLGIKLFELGVQVQNSMDLRSIANPFLNELVNNYGETVHLVMNNAGQAVYIDKVEGTASMRMYSQVGKEPPMYCTGVGKVILAHMSDDFIRKYVAKETFHQLTPNTIIDGVKLIEELNAIRKQGFSIDDEEIEIGLKCVSAPIKNHRAEVVGAISIAGPTSRMTKEKLDILSEPIKQVALEISYKLGYKE